MEKTLKRKNISLTEGPLFKNMLVFVLPLMATNLLQTCYNVADMMVVGMSKEPDAVGAIGVTASFISLRHKMFIGFATGAKVILARHLGSKNSDGASKTTHTAILMSLIFGGGAALIGMFISRPVLSLMGAEGKLLDLAVTYTLIYFAGVPFISLTNYASAIFRAKGDTRTPLVVLSIAGLVNVLLNVFFVMVANLSVEGVALATAIANIVSAAILLIILMRDNGDCRLSLSRLRIDKVAFMGILKIGLPAGIQGALFSLSNILIQSSILKVNNSVVPYESDFQPVVKGNAAAANIESFIYTATNSVYQASMTFTSQNFGASRLDRVKRVMWNSYLLTFMIGVLFSGLCLALRTPLLSLYGISDGVDGSLAYIAYHTALKRFLIVSSPYFLLGFMEVGSGVLRGLGRSVTSTVISLVGSCLFRIAWLYTAFVLYESVDVIYLSYPISWIITAIVEFILAYIIIDKMLRGKVAQSHIEQVN